MSSLCPSTMLVVTQKTLAIEHLPHHKTLQNMALTNKGDWVRPTELYIVRGVRGWKDRGES